MTCEVLPCQSKPVPVSLRRYRLQVQHHGTCPKRKARQLSNAFIIGNGIFKRRNYLLPPNPSDLELIVYFQEGISYSNLFQVLRFNTALFLPQKRGRGLNALLLCSRGHISTQQGLIFHDPILSEAQSTLMRFRLILHTFRCV